jgi:hypothetical protein
MKSKNSKNQYIYRLISFIREIKMKMNSKMRRAKEEYKKLAFLNLISYNDLNL